MTSGPTANGLGISLAGQGSFEQFESVSAAQENEIRVERETKKEEAGFFVGPNGQALPAKYKGWIGTNRRDQMLSGISNKQLKNVINQSYRKNAFIGDGGTAAMIRFEKATGLKLGRNGGDHTKKGRETIKRLKKILRRRDLSPAEKATAEKMIRDITDALGE